MPLSGMSVSIGKKIGLSMSLLIAGYIGSMLVGFFLEARNEVRLQRVSTWLFPAAQESQRALSSYQELVDLLFDGFSTGETEFEYVPSRCQEAVDALTRIVNLAVEEETDVQDVVRLSRDIEAYTAEAVDVYRAMAEQEEEEPDEEAEIEEGVEVEDILGARGKALALKQKRLEGDLVALDKMFGDKVFAELEEVSEASHDAMLTNIVVFFVVVGAALTLVSVIISRKIISPLKKAARLADRVAKGDRSARLDLHQKDEIGELATALNEMTRQLHQSVEGLQEEIAERKKAQRELAAHRDDLEEIVAVRTEELEKTNREMVNIARQAGMAEVATGVLHNVGNVLNSVNVTATMVRDSIDRSRVLHLSRVVTLMDDHQENFVEFLTEDERGRLLPKYLGALSEHLVGERENVLSYLDELNEHVEHISEIVALQQTVSRVGGVIQAEDVVGVMESALQMVSRSLSNHGISVVREYEELPMLMLDRHKILQILVNLLSNAKQAVHEARREEKIITVRICQTEPGRFAFEVQDNGIGISDEEMGRMFRHGFTTKKDGHGYGLHSGACSAREMGGSLTATSEGKGHGATFTLELEYRER